MNRDPTSDLQLLNEVLQAAQTPCPTAADYYNASSTPWLIDPLIHELDRPDVRALMLQRLTRSEAFGWPWWGYRGLGEGYEEDRHKLIHRIRSLREELKHHVDHTDALNNPRSPWTPSMHQQKVLKVLRRDGRLRAAELHRRVTPSHIGRRAHQNAMKELVNKGLVKRAGKARATEYWMD